MEIIAQGQTNQLRYLVAKFDEDAATLEALVQPVGFGDEVRSEARKVEILGAQLLLNHLFGHEVQRSHHPDGAPFVEGFDGYVSVSHSKRYIAVAIHPTQPVGIDIEVNTDRAQRLRERFMKPTELTDAPASWQMREKALVTWCAKEAAYKCMPRPAVDFLTDMQVTYDNDLLSVTYDRQIVRLMCQITPDWCLVVGGIGLFS